MGVILKLLLVMVAKLGLVTVDHPKTYALHWLDNGRSNIYELRHNGN